MLLSRALLACVAVCTVRVSGLEFAGASTPHGRRAVLHAGTAALLTLPAVSSAAEPEPAKILTEEEMAARVAKKMELLKKQGAKGRADVKVKYDANYLKGVRGASTNTGFAPDTSPNLRFDTKK